MSKPWKKKFGKYFYNWLYSLKGWKTVSTNNYGYAPLDAGMADRFPQEPYQMQLYHEVGKALQAEVWHKSAIIEIGCGRGGGLMHLEKVCKPAAATGMDYSTHAVSFATRTASAASQNIRFVQGDASALPFAAASADVMLNVESSHIYPDQPQFLREVARVLRPGGHFVIADYRARGEAWQTFSRDLEQAGLQVIAERDITGAVYEACLLDSARRAALIADAPRLVRPYMGNYSMLAGSDELTHFREKYYYYLIHAVKHTHTL